MGNSLTKCCKESAPDEKILEETEVEYTPSNGTPNGYKKPISGKHTGQSQIDVVDSTSIDSKQIMHRIDTPSTTTDDESDEKLNPNHYYKMNHKKRGMALIFNHEIFNCNSPRRGTNADRTNLQKTLESLDFEVQIFENEVISDIKGVLKEIAAMNHSDCDCLMIIILSHGDIVPFRQRGKLFEATILTHDLVSYVDAADNKYPLQMIWEQFTDENCPSLANKPRIFLVTACQGNDHHASYGTNNDSYRQRAHSRDTTPFSTTKYKPFDAVQIDKKKTLPQKDFLIVYSTMPGYLSYRDTEMGTWYIESFCKVLNTKKHELDLFQILTLINQKVAIDYESDAVHKQMPCIVSMLTKLIVFPKKKPVTNGF